MVIYQVSAGKTIKYTDPSRPEKYEITEKVKEGTNGGGIQSL